jgi:hypothetical protein
MEKCITEKHVCHLEDLTDEQLNKLLNNIVDMENLYISISRQDDLDIKKVNFMEFPLLEIAILIISFISGLHLPLKASPSLHPHEESINSHRSRTCRRSAFRNA